MQENPLHKLKALGQSIWLDFIDRALLSTGKLAQLIEHDGLAGLTSNPAIFEKAMGHAGQYDEAIRAALGERLDTKALYEALALEDVQAAADSFAPAYAAAGGADGFVSLEVSPHLADDTEATIREAKRLWTAFDRPNAMIKVPATRAGLGAITTLVADGININVTLLFGVARYREVADAFLTGLERRAVAGAPVDQQASVASFFVSRIDTLIDEKLEALGTPEGRALRGQAAIAAARLAYQYYKQWTTSRRWRRLADAGARPQRLLWASTSTKDPAYSDIKYVEALIGPETVNTVPLQTLDAYRKHGRPAARLETDLLEAMALPDALARCGIDLDDVSAQLEREGVRKFAEAFDQLLASLERRTRELQSGR
jgi:transaldolase